MIDEAIGKILGMAMAYAVSGLGLFLAYANYRRRTVGAARVMTPAAWWVLAAVAAATVGGVVVVRELAQRSAAELAAATEAAQTAETEVPLPAAEEATTAAPAPVPAGERPRWPWIGILLPAAVLLAATWVTGWLYLHFQRGAAAAPAPGSPPTDPSRG